MEDKVKKKIRKDVIKWELEFIKVFITGHIFKGIGVNEIDELIIDSGVLSDYQCIDPHTPDEFYPFQIII